MYHVQSNLGFFVGVIIGDQAVGTQHHGTWP
jgi:hypothetical protein